MDPKLILTVFSTVFLAELGDKTQLATLLFSARNADARWAVFASASLGLILACAVGVLAGALVAKYLNPQLLARIAGAAFIVIGVITIWKA